MRNPGKLLLSKLRPGSTSCKHQQHTNTSTEQNSCTSQSTQNNYTQPNKTATTAIDNIHMVGGTAATDTTIATAMDIPRSAAVTAMKSRAFGMGLVDVTVLIHTNSIQLTKSTAISIFGIFICTYLQYALNF